MILGLFNAADAWLPEKLVVDAWLGRLIVLFQGCDGKSRFEKENWDGFHQFYRVYFIIEEFLLMPHRLQKELFLFEN